jgi:cephalosporin hydroxylase
MNEIAEFNKQRINNIKSYKVNEGLLKSRRKFLNETIKAKYSYNFNWLGIPIIQYPQDIVAMQELVWEIKPDLIIETGVAHGGSIIFYASMLELLGGNRKVIGIDTDIREHNKKRMEEHPMFKRVELIQGSSIDLNTINKVKNIAKDYKTILVCLDSMHTHEHVLKELELYSPFVTKDSYLVVFDTIVEDLPDELWQDRPWKKGNNPKTAVFEFLKNNSDFEINQDIDNKLLISVAPSGYLKRVK